MRSQIMIPVINDMVVGIASFPVSKSYLSQGDPVTNTILQFGIEFGTLLSYISLHSLLCVCEWRGLLH